MTAIDIPWKKTLGAKLAAITLVLFALVLSFVLADFLVLSSLRGEMNWVNHAGKGRRSSYQLLYLGIRLLHEPKDTRAVLEKEFRDEIEAMGERYRVLREGDTKMNIPAASDQRILEQLKTLETRYREEIKPRADRLVKAPLAEAGLAELTAFDPLLRKQSDETNQIVEVSLEDTNRAMQRTQMFQYGLIVIVLAVLGLILWIGRDIVRRIQSLAHTADRIASGELSATAPVTGSDELAALGSAFNTMTANLQKIIDTEKKGRARIESLLENIREAAGQLSSASVEILAGTSQQAAGAQEQAAAVSQTVITVDEVAQTSDQAVQRAKVIGETVQRSLDIGKTGRKVVEDSLDAMQAVKEKVETTAENILMLAQQALAISEIIATVNDIAEQTNLLALNAAIEASRAGEHGKGFNVVASEVKALADQSKKATAQVRQILGEIQKATDTAVLSTEEVTRGVASAIKVGGQAGETIKTLADTLTETSQAVKQIAASVGQQATGMGQIHQAMKNIDQVAKQNTVATRQAAQAAENLNTLGTRLTSLTAE